MATTPTEKVPASTSGGGCHLSKTTSISVPMTFGRQEDRKVGGPVIGARVLQVFPAGGAGIHQLQVARIERPLTAGGAALAQTLRDGRPCRGVRGGPGRNSGRSSRCSVFVRVGHGGGIKRCCHARNMGRSGLRVHPDPHFSRASAKFFRRKTSGPPVKWGQDRQAKEKRMSMLKAALLGAMTPRRPRSARHGAGWSPPPEVRRWFFETFDLDGDGAVTLGGKWKAPARSRFRRGRCQWRWHARPFEELLAAATGRMERGYRPDDRACRRGRRRAALRPRGNSRGAVWPPGSGTP